jgi:hypothetical protein
LQNSHNTFGSAIQDSGALPDLTTDGDIRYVANIDWRTPNLFQDDLANVFGLGN